MRRAHLPHILGDALHVSHSVRAQMQSLKECESRHLRQRFFGGRQSSFSFREFAIFSSARADMNYVSKLVTFLFAISFVRVRPKRDRLVVVFFLLSLFSSLCRPPKIRSHKYDGQIADRIFGLHS